jgi:regulator of protease activity HflC (stomatin/prohibitin superfamily)
MSNVRNVNINRNASRIFLIIVVLALLIGIISSTIIFVPPDQIGVVVSVLAPDGYRKDPLFSGLHFVVPVLETVEKYSIARQTYTMSAATSEGQREGDDSIRVRTKDGQEVFMDSSVIYAINPPNVVNLHITWQKRYSEELVRPLVRGIIRDAASQYGVEEIVSSKRAELETYINTELSTKLSANDLVLVDFVLRDIHFSEEYAAAVEQKQIAEQQALQAELVVEQRKQEAEQARQVAQGQADAAVIEAKGAAEARLVEANAEAEANRTLAESVTPELVSYLYVIKLSPGVQTVFLPSDNQFILPLPGTATQATQPTPSTQTETPPPTTP